MLQTSDLLKTKLLKYNSHIAALTYIISQLGEIVDQDVSSCNAVQKSTTLRGGKSKSEMEACDLEDSSQSLSGNSYQDESTSTTRRLLGRLGIELDQDPSGEELRHLSGLVADQERECNRKSREVESSILSAIKADKDGVSDSQDQLLDALLIDTKHRNIKMADAELEARTKSLATALRCMGLEVAKLDSGMLHCMKDKQQDFVDRWNAH